MGDPAEDLGVADSFAVWTSGLISFISPPLLAFAYKIMQHHNSGIRTCVLGPLLLLWVIIPTLNVVLPLSELLWVGRDVHGEGLELCVSCSCEPVLEYHAAGAIWCATADRSEIRSGSSHSVVEICCRLPRVDLHRVERRGQEVDAIRIIPGNELGSEGGHQRGEWHSWRSVGQAFDPVDEVEVRGERVVQR